MFAALLANVASKKHSMVFDPGKSLPSTSLCEHEIGATEDWIANIDYYLAADNRRHYYRFYSGFSLEESIA